MFDSNDYLNSLFNTDYSSSTTTTETETESQSTYSPQTDYSSNSSYERDDYSSAQNFTEQQSYNSFSSNSFAESETKTISRQMNTPMIEKSAPAVNLVKSKARMVLETRMKIVLSVFSVIVACLLFVSIFNFISAGKIEASFLGKQQQINSLEQSISNANDEYIRVSEDALNDYISENGCKPKDGNTIVINIDEVYEEQVLQEIPSNWFNDVCEFFSKLFA